MVLRLVREGKTALHDPAPETIEYPPIMMNARAPSRFLACLALLWPLACVAARAGEPARVLEVFDADTLLVQMSGGRREKVRLLGVDAPEVEGYRDAEPGGEEAKAWARRLLASASIRLEDDETADQRDQYGRLLRYVRLEDGRDLGETLIADGYARAYRRFSYGRKRTYLARESEAKAAGHGLWGAGQGP
jgi:endonuclease YncB( thermonuclease family)